MDAPERELVVRDDIAPEDLAYLETQIDEHNIATTGLRDGRRLAILLRDGTDRIEAGLAGHTWGGACEVRFLWVDAPLRGRGLGRRLLRAAEDEARARGCAKLVLSTHSFQAPGFYRKLGYAPAGAFDGYPRGHRQIFLEKRLSAPPPGRPAGGEAPQTGGHRRDAPQLARYARARRAGGLLFLAGLSARRPDGSIPGAGAGPSGAPEPDVRVQTQGCIENLRAALAAEGLGLGSLVDVTVFLVHMADYGGFNEAWNRFFDAESGPARTTVAVHQLPDPRLVVELKAVARAPSADG